MSDDKQTRVKKVSPYPFEATIEGNGRKLPIRILKLAPVGFYADVAPGFVKVGEEFNCVLEIPVLRDVIVGPVKVFKTADTFKDTPAGRQLQRISEFHFLALQESHRDAIQKFLSAIGQT